MKMTKLIRSKQTTRVAVPLSVYLTLAERAVASDASEAVVRLGVSTVAWGGGFSKTLAVRDDTHVVTVGLTYSTGGSAALSVSVTSPRGVMDVAVDPTRVAGLIAGYSAVGRWITECTHAVVAVNEQLTRLYFYEQLRSFFDVDNLLLADGDAGRAYASLTNLSWFNIVVVPNDDDVDIRTVERLAMDARRKLTGLPLTTLDEIVDLAGRTLRHAAVEYVDDEFAVLTVNREHQRRRCVIAVIDGEPTFTTLMIDGELTSVTTVVTNTKYADHVDLERSARLERRLMALNALID